MREIDLEIKRLDQKQTFRCLGYGPDADPSPEVVELLNICTHAAQKAGVPRGIYTTVPIVGSGNGVILTERGPIKSRALADAAGNARQLVFCLVTLGIDWDRKIEECTDLLQTCIWDAIGTVLVEHGVDLILADIQEKFGTGTSLPFSPGYCDWSMEGQRVIFSAFDDEPLGIRLFPESLMMVPQKSISFVVCLGVEAKKRNPCRRCTLQSCFMRR